MEEGQSVTYLEPGLSLVLFLLALALIVRRRRVLFTSAALVILFLWSWPPVDALTAWTLERPYLAGGITPQGTGDAIVVLSSGGYPKSKWNPEDQPDYGTYQRCLHAAWLYHNGYPLPVIVSGGHIPVNGREVSLSTLMQRLMEQNGVPTASITREDRSHTTYENAVYSAEILRARGMRRILLVTEAHHMPRAERCFRRQGIDVVPAPCGFRSPDFTGLWTQFVPSPKSINGNEEELHEWVGLVWYKLSGKI